MAKATIEKAHLVGSDGSTVAAGVSQLTLVDQAVSEPQTLGPGWVYWHGAGTEGFSGVIELLALVLKSGDAVPTVTTGALRDTLEERLWFQVSVALSDVTAGTMPMLIKTQRSLKTGDRLVLVCVTHNFAATPQTRSVAYRGQLMQIQG